MKKNKNSTNTQRATIVKNNSGCRLNKEIINSLKEKEIISEREIAILKKNLGYLKLLMEIYSDGIHKTTKYPK